MIGFMLESPSVVWITYINVKWGVYVGSRISIKMCLYGFYAVLLEIRWLPLKVWKELGEVHDIRTASRGYFQHSRQVVFRSGSSYSSFLVKILVQSFSDGNTVPLGCRGF